MATYLENSRLLGEYPRPPEVATLAETRSTLQIPVGIRNDRFGVNYSAEASYVLSMSAFL